MKNKILVYILSFAVICLSIFSITQYVDKLKTEQIVKEYKQTLIKSDSLRQVQIGFYQKLVDDTNTQRDLTILLKEQNKELYKIIKEEKKKPISYTVIQAQPISKIDTTTINKDEESGLDSFDIFYPSKEDYFLNYHGEFNSFNNLITGEWKSNPFELSIVVSEKTKGLYEADLNAPDWLKVKKVTVHSLPLENLSKDNFDWVLGGALGVNYLNKTPLIEVEAGIRIKKSIITLQGNTNQDIKIGFKKLF